MKQLAALASTVALVVLGAVLVCGQLRHEGDDVGAAFGDRDNVPSVRVYTRPVSLQVLVGSADRIFTGYVRSVTPVPDHPSKVRAERVDFEIQRAIKGPLGRTLTVYQPEGLGIFRRGSTLLVYLAPDSSTGFAQPVGIHSGYFDIVPVSDSYTKRKYEAAVNLNDNAGLWGGAEKGSLVGSSRRAEADLKCRIARIKDVGERRLMLTSLLHAADAPPLPLELLILATESLMKTDSKDVPDGKDGVERKD